MNNAIGPSQQFSKLRLEYNVLKERVASQIEILTHLVNVEGPNLKANYMMLIGQFEHRVFELKIDINRWKRRFALRQAALNRGEKPDILHIEAELDAEFAEYLAQIKTHIEEIKEASLLYHSVRMAEEEGTAIRCAYLDAVKKLHPDLNPNLSSAAIELWHQIQSAYDEKDWEQVRLLTSLVDAVVEGSQEFGADENALTALQTRYDKLKEKSAELSRQTNDVKSKVPFTYEVVLEDEDLVSAKQAQLTAQINSLEDCIKEYEELWRNGK